VAEAIFKALAKSLRQAVSIDPCRSDIPSTKGVL
jgi:imidazoleglycerol phosphate dehydratase HisB